MDKNKINTTPENQAFLQDLYQKNYVRIYNYIKSYISDTNIIKDLTADVFVLACEKINILQTHPSPEAWLYIVAKNKLREFFRRVNQENSILCSADLDNIPDNSPYNVKDLELTLHNALTPREYERYLRYFIWGQSLEELATYEGITKTNMAVRLSRLRVKIKEMLQIK